MRNYFICVFITILFIGTYAENDLSLEDFFKQSESIIKNSDNKIRIFTRYDRSINAEFINFKNDTLVYFDIVNHSEESIPLIDVQHIVTKNNKRVFDGDVYIERYHKDYAIKNKKNQDNTNKYFEERTVIALEKIAKAQTYFMVYSIVMTLLSLVLIVVSL